MNALQEEKLKLSQDLNSLTTQIDHKNNTIEKEQKEKLNSDGEKLVNAGWTIAKVHLRSLKPCVHWGK